MYAHRELAREYKWVALSGERVGKMAEKKERVLVDTARRVILDG